MFFVLNQFRCKNAFAHARRRRQIQTLSLFLNLPQPPLSVKEGGIVGVPPLIERGLGDLGQGMETIKKLPFFETWTGLLDVYMSKSVMLDSINNCFFESWEIFVRSRDI
jgi:hypothetical protein